MSQSSTPSRQPRRRRSSSGLFTNGLVAVCLIVGCVYAVWGSGPLKRVWTGLGFGKGATPASVKIKKPAENSAISGTDESPRKIVPPPPLPLAELDAESLKEEAEQAPFFPEKRPRKDLKIIRPQSVDAASSASELDERFELDSQNLFDSKSNSVRTAEFEEPAAATRTRPKSPKHKKIQFEVDTIDTVVDHPKENGVRQIGDEVEADSKPNASPSAKSGNAKTASVPKRGTIPVKPASNTPGGTEQGPLNIQDVQNLIETGHDADAYQKLADAYSKFPKDRPQFQEHLDRIAQRIYFTPQPQIEPPYEIAPGDQLRKIAAKYHLSWQYLSKLNQVDAKKIRPGKKLKVFQGPFNAIVDLSEYELVVLLNGKFVKRYQVGTGKDNSSPIGEFTVKEKLENPVYYGPEGNVLAAEDPTNPLGERWIDIGNSFGIHGTIEPDSIGKSASAGCVRMRNEDVAEVYDLLTIGSTVVIQR